MAGRIKALSLYKNILRAHDKFLPHEMKQLGDAYVKSEFRLHKEAKAEQVTLFYTEWEKYLEHIERTGRENKAINAGLLDGVQQESSQSIDNTMVKQNTTSNNNRQFGQNVPEDIGLNDEQKNQLIKLREEAIKAGEGKI